MWSFLKSQEEDSSGLGQQISGNDHPHHLISAFRGKKLTKKKKGVKQTNCYKPGTIQMKVRGSLTLKDLMYSDVSDKLLHCVVFEVTVTTVHLESLVADLYSNKKGRFKRKGGIRT